MDRGARWSALLLVGCGLAAQAMAAETGGFRFANRLMPVPAKLTAGEGFVPVTEEMTVSATGVSDERMEGAIRRATRRVAVATGLSLPWNPGQGDASVVLVHARGKGDAVQGVEEDESYTLVVGGGKVRIDAPTVTGAMHGLETMVQLVQPGPGGYVLPEVSIEDSPRFRWRGLMIDCGRHFEPVEVIKRTIDAMAAVKMNVFHWHLTEDQGFRMESRLFPALTAKGSDGLFYTQAEAREVVQYARARGVRVVPEFEMPGHSTAWIYAYPELSSGKAPEGIRREFGIANFAMDPTREETYRFLERFLGEMVGIFPDAYLHIGGDETPAPDWKTNPRIREFMTKHDLKDSEALQAYFNQRVLQILTRLHRRMIGWDEILNPALPKEIVVQSWRGQESLIKGAKQGYQGVLSAPYYLDAMKTAETHYLADPLPATVDLTPEQRRLILGGEVCMWSEQINERSIDSRIWPRTAAIAERFWSAENVRDVNDMYRRLERTSVELEGFGLRHISHEDAALRELAGTERIDALRTFASVLEPVSFHERYQQQKTSQLTVLDRLVDAVRPDPPTKHAFELLLRSFFMDPRGNAADGERLTAMLKEVAAATPEVRRQMDGSPLLAEARGRAAQVDGLLETCTEAVHFLASGTKAPDGWKARQMARIDEARKPSAIVRWTFLEPLTVLVNAAAEGKP